MRFYLTTAIDYVNSRPHLGTAYEKITADVIARQHRLCGDDTHFVMGNDEHSQNVFRRARELGEEPAAYCDRMEHVFREVWGRLAISFDDFIRTTEPRHRAAVQQLVQRCADAGDVYEGVYEGWYCVSCESFKQEKDLVDGQCPIHLRAPEWIREKNYFFRLSRYRDRLFAHFEAHPEFLQPEIRRNEIVRLLEGGLDDISISRAGQAWGIPLPFDPQSVVYVWFDALINYASAVGYATDHAQCARWWPADLHVIGKDITRFHTVIWPAMLMSAGLDLPRQVFGHGWVHFKGQKMSKSLGTVVDPIDAAERLGPDPLRLFLVKEFPYGADGDFSWERFDERYNVDLANNLGNLVSRVSTMIERYRGGAVSASPLGPGRLAQVAADAVEAYRGSIGRLALQDAASSAFRLIDATNEFIAQSEPWVLARQDAASDRLTQVLFDAAEAVRIAAVLLWPIMPDSSTEILRRSGEPLVPSALRFETDTAWKGSLARRFERGSSLWPRLGESADSAQIVAKEIVVTQESSSPAAPVSPPASDVTAAPEGVAAAPRPPLADPIGIEDFMRIDLRVARILEAERVPKSKKLLKLRVDLGFEQRTIVAGIAEAYEPDGLVGRQIVVVANLKPATLMGIESNGMVLAGSVEGGKPELVAFVDPPPPGARVR
ncbi:MAG: methionine--tRNA ligase [Vicinamibacterales bacterium]